MMQGTTATETGNRFHQTLGKMTYFQACHWLGPNGAELLAEGGHEFEVDPEDAYLGGDLYRARIHDPALLGGVAVITVTMTEDRQSPLHFQCDQCDVPCRHLGAAIGYLLDARSTMGLSEPPDESVPLENLTHDELYRRAMADRQKRAEEEPMRVRPRQADRPWTEYMVTNAISGRTYRVALCGTEPGQSYCSCPDFRTNHLGTCKHILHTLDTVRSRFSAADLRMPYYRHHVALAVHYGSPRGLRFHLPTRRDRRLSDLVAPYAEETLTDAEEAVRRVEQLRQHRTPVQVYPDAEEWIQRQLVQKRVRSAALAIRDKLEHHPLLHQLLKTDLLPYQLDGIAFAAAAGRAILADDMGLGKTVQGIGLAELLARLAEIRRVLIVSPASVKSQWQEEIASFSNRSVQMILGDGKARAASYGRAFFTVCNYEQVLRDLAVVEGVPWDLIILDEGQRIKNWESKISRAIRSLRSTYALVLSGTPLENRLDELFTVSQFVDEALLGPAHQFFHRHRVVDEKGRVLGYRRLDELRETLRPVLLRRSRADVAPQLPERTDEVVRIVPTAEQLELHDGQLRIVAEITRKQMLTQLDLLRLRSALANARMAANSTFLVDKQEPEYSSKLDRLAELLGALAQDPSRKMVVFSEWRMMLDRIERILEQSGLRFVRLDGQVPQTKRAEIVAEFQDQPDCRVILMTNAGSVGLNLQSANTVINVDLPWNPAVLEQRIARAHRMGQQNPVHVYKLVTENTIEQRLLDTLAMKQELADAALDWDSDVSEVDMPSRLELLRQRLSPLLPLLPAQDDAHEEERAPESRVVETAVIERSDAISDTLAVASGQWMSASLKLLSCLLTPTETSAKSPELVDRLHQRLASALDRDASGRPQFRVTLPDDSALRLLAEALAGYSESNTSGDAKR